MLQKSIVLSKLSPQKLSMLFEMALFLAILLRKSIVRMIRC